MKYSIIVPCYNEEKNLEKLVIEFNKNLINKEDNIEVILVNNGSTDNSKKVLKKITSKYDFIKVVDIEKNIGYGYGILAGLKAANGDYLSWIHADLQFNPSEIKKGIDYLKENKFPKNIYIKGLRRNRPFIDKIFTIGMSIYESMILKRKMWDINAQPTIMSRDIYKKWNNPPYDFSLDLYSYYIAKKNECNIYRYDVIQHERYEGKSTWNNGIKSRIKLIKRVLSYSKTIRNDVK